MKAGAYAIVTWVGIMLAYYAVEHPSLLTGVKIGAFAVAVMIAGAIGVAANYVEEENEDAN